MPNEQYEEIRQVILKKEIPNFIQREIAMENTQKKYDALVDEMELSEQRHYIAYKKLVEEKEKKEAQMLKQIQNLLVANHTIKRREEQAIEDLEKLLYPESVDKQKVVV